MNQQENFNLPWYAVLGLLLAVSVISVLLFARPLDTTLKPGEEIPAGVITGPAKE